MVRYMDIKKLWEEIPFPTTGNKQDMICWIINTQEQTIFRWQILFIGQLIFWVTLFSTGKIWLGWFP